MRPGPSGSLWHQQNSQRSEEKGFSQREVFRIREMLELEGVTKIFNRGSIDEKVALQHIHLKVEKGEFITIIGSNGAGKTTLLNAITGSVLVDDGNVVIDGLDVTHLPEFKRGRLIGRVFQNPLMGTASEMTIEENLSMALLRGKSRGG